jgi:hypothetical protein
VNDKLTKPGSIRHWLREHCQSMKVTFSRKKPR